MMNSTNVSPVVASLDTGTLLLIVLCSMSAFLGVGGNILNLIVLPRLPNGSMGEATKILFLFISVTCLLQALTLLTRPIVLSNLEWTAAYAVHFLCKATGTIESYLFGMSIFFIFIINLDRYIFVIWPYAYNNVVTKNRIIIMVIVYNIFHFCSSLIAVSTSEGSFNKLQFIPYYGGCTVPLKNSVIRPYLMLSHVAIWLVPIFLIFMYTQIFCIARRHARKIWAQQNAAIRLVTLSGAVATTDPSNSTGQPFREKIKVTSVGSSEDEAAVCLKQHDDAASTARSSNSCGQPSRDEMKVVSVDSSPEKAAVRLVSLDDTVATAGPSSNCSQPSQGEMKFSSNGLAQQKAAVGDAVASACPSGSSRQLSKDRTKWVRAPPRNRKLKNHWKLFRRNLYTVRTPLIITGSYLITWLPSTILNTVVAMSAYQPNKVVMSFATALSLGNCCMPCLVYLIVRPDFRKTVRRLMLCHDSDS